MLIEWKTGAHAPNQTWAVLDKVMLVLWLTPDKDYPGDVPEGAKHHWSGRVRVDHTANVVHGRVSAVVEFYLSNLGDDLPKAKEAITHEFKAFAETVARATQHGG